MAAEAEAGETVTEVTVGEVPEPSEGGEEVAFELRSSHGKVFLLELKSTFGVAVSMSERQGEKAATSQSSFALCVIPLQTEQIDQDILRTNARFVPEVGRLLENAVVKFNDLRNLEIQTASVSDDVDVLIQGSQVKYSIKQPIWSGGLEFNSFIAYLLTFFAYDRPSNS